MKSRIFFVTVILLLLTSALPAGPVALMKELPPAANRIRMAGQSYLCSPAADRAGNVFVPWRYITGVPFTASRDLVESVFVQVLNSRGRSLFGGVPRLAYQGVFGLVDHHGNPADGSCGVVPDEAGGVFYLFGAYVMHMDTRGKNDWPPGDRKGAKELWRTPSKTRMIADPKRSMGDIRFWPDGRGNAVGVWSGDGVFAQKISRDGRLLWGAGGLPLFVQANSRTRARGRAVPDGRGGLVALLTVKGYKDAHIVFYDAAGNKTGSKKFMTMNLSNDSIYRLAPDWNGGAYVLYAKKTRRGKPPRGYTYIQYREVRLIHVDAAGRIRLNEVVSAPGIEIDPKRMILRSNPKGQVAAAWQYVVPGRKAADDRIRVWLARFDARGRNAWGKTVEIEMPLAPGPAYTRNDDAHRDILISGTDTYIAFDGMIKSDRAQTGYWNTIFLNKIDRSGSLAHKGRGRVAATSHGGYKPYLFSVKGRPALVYFDSLNVSGVEAVSPYFQFAD